MQQSKSAQMLTALFEDSDDGFIELRVIRRPGPPRQEWFEVVAASSAADRAVELRAHGDVYFGVVPRTRREGTKGAVGSSTVLWADLDSPDSLLTLVGFAVLPSLIVASGSPGSHHAYWLLTAPISKETLESTNRRLAVQLGADLRCTDAGRILRVAGTLNHKTDPPAEVSLMYFTRERYDLDELLAALPEEEGSPTPRVVDTPAGASPPVADVLALLEQVTATTNGWTARCPAHHDRNPSLSVAQGDDGRALIHCFAGCTPEAIMQAIDRTTADLYPTAAGSRERTARDRLISLVDREQVELFHDSAGRAYAKIALGGHREVWNVDSTRFARWIQRVYYHHHSSSVAAEAVREVASHFAAQANFDAPERAVHRRVGGDPERMWVDLGDDDWTVAEIRNDGTWALRDDAPVDFIREPGALALPRPVPGGSIDLMRPLVNIPDDRAWTLYRGALIATYHPTGPYFVTFLHGSAGSGKTMAARWFAQLVDPYTAQFLTGTSTEHDAMVAASKCRLLPIDNLSRLTRGWSDLLCVNSTGAGDRRRGLYTNDELFALMFKGPALITSLTLLANRGDLIDRLVPIGFDRITDNAREPETRLNAKFHKIAPAVLGGLFSAVASALRHGPETNLNVLPRMADATLFVTAAENALGAEAGTFARVLGEAQDHALTETIGGDPFVDAVVRFMTHRSEWTGSATRLMEEAAKLLEHGPRTRGWPPNASAASAKLSEFELPLRAQGITTERSRSAGGNRDRAVTLRRLPHGTTGTTGTA